MTENQFEELLVESIRAYGGDYIEIPEEMWRPHKFSLSFKLRMWRILRRERKICMPKRRIPLRRIITIIVTVLLAASIMAMSVSAVRNVVIGFISDVFEKYTTVRPEPSAEAPMVLEEYYEITWMPEGYELLSEYRDPFQISQVFMQENENSDIVFRQEVLYGYVANYNTEEADMQPAVICGEHGFIIEWNGVYIFVWENREYVFEVTITSNENGKINKSVAERIANSVKMMECEEQHDGEPV